MSYEPKPVDTGAIDASILAPVREKLAEHVHDLWAQSRMKSGWTYGTVQDGQKKQTPSLIAYAALPEEEKDIDRRSAIEPIKVLLASGYSLTPPCQTPAGAFVASPKPRPDAEIPDDDMSDDREPRTAPAALLDALAFIKAETWEAYSAANATASDCQTKFRAAAKSSVFAAVISVLMAIFQLAAHIENPVLHTLLPAIELLLVIYALGAVVCASFYKKWHLRWLSERSKAERMRALKFRFLLDPRSWDPAAANQARADFRENIRHLKSAVPETLPGWLTELMPDPPPPAQLTADRQLHEAVTEYYLSRRLIGQARFLHRKAKQMHSEDGGTKVGGYVLYYMVLVFVFSHAATDLIDSVRGGATEDQTSRMFSRFFITCAAMLPVIGAAVHTYRAGRETARNHLRYETGYKRLSAIQADLEQSTSQPEQIRLMLASEAALASEHQQWLQLMYECEWFG